jgi:Tol biopolymer transport system component
VAALFILTCISEGRARAALALDAATATLASEVRDKGWVVFSARSPNGDWDLYACRPDGSDRRSLTQSRDYNEFSPQFSRDTKRLLFRRIPYHEKIDNNRYGEQGELILADADASSIQVLGKRGDFPWASWSPDGRQIASLSIKGVALVDLATGRTVRTIPRKGLFQQTTWSPDGQWICGVANSFGSGWSIARLCLATEQVNAVNTVDCCTPDWFPNGQDIIFSWRPPGQKTNRGNGWTQLWRASADGTTRSLVYGEDGRHIYGGQISPDGRYALFTGNMQEDGDPGNAGSPMGLLRLSDAPIIRGQSSALREQHSEAKEGPVLALPVGWEPTWTSADLFASSAKAESGESNRKMQSRLGEAQAGGSLAADLHNQGWIVYSAKAKLGDWDLFLMRPDGSDRHAITQTAEFNEAGARFSPDGTRLLYYRMPKATPVDNNTYGTFDLVVAKSDGTHPIVYGPSFQWASWSPDGERIACLSNKGIEIVDLDSRSILRQFSRKGIVQQLIWSPDGMAFVGTANGLGPYWNIGCLTVASSGIKAVSETERYNCTPDWCPDSKHVVYARGIIPQSPGRAELWVADCDGTERHCVYAEEGRHIYGACASPDQRFLLFTRSIEDLGQARDTEMAIIRWPDSAAQPGQSDKSPRLDLGPGWEPHWTRAGMSSLAR